MKLIALNCRQCGAPLSVPDDVKHVTCMHCGTQLGVVHEGGAAYTEKLEQLDQRTCEIEERIEELDRQQKLTQLDQSWQREQKQYYIKDKNGVAHKPSAGGALIPAVLFGGIAIAIPIFTIVNRAPSEMVGFACLGSAVVGTVGLVTTIVHYNKATSYQNAERRYRRRRQQILNRDPSNN